MIYTNSIFDYTLDNYFDIFSTNVNIFNSFLHSFKINFPVIWGMLISFLVFTLFYVIIRRFIK